MLGLLILLTLLVGISFAFALSFVLKVSDKLRWGYCLSYAISETISEMF